ncbi:MAG: hypothetical protein EBY39_10060 [Flavobacteriia bacterium]|nr:hypothetical protein [Flavobacteriia bacterium]
METETKLSLSSSLEEATDAQVDAVWAILKYREIGIYRKVASICEVLNLDFNKVVSELPSDEEGRILDHKTRHLIHDALMSLIS